MIEFTETDKPFGLYSGDFSHIEKWIIQAIDEEEKVLGEINIINSSDEYLLEINKKYLKHNYYTDVITFDYVVDDLVSGDIFISEDRIIENAKERKIPKREEFLRVVIHGVLHLLGYKDNTKDQKQIMREKENYYLEKF